MMLNDAPTLSLPCWIAKAQDAMGQFTAQIVGLPDLRATANSPEEAVQGVRKLVAEAVVSGRLAQISVPLPLSSTSCYSCCRQFLLFFYSLRLLLPELANILTQRKSAPA